MAGRIDIIEGFNGRTDRQEDNTRAVEFARMHTKPVSTGSDAYHPIDLGKIWVDLEPFSTPNELLFSLKQGRIHSTSRTR